MWVLEPERLGNAVTGKPFVSFVSALDARKQHEATGIATHGKSRQVTNELGPPPQEHAAPASPGIDGEDSKASRRRVSLLLVQQKADNQIFIRKKELALYIIDQVNLLTQMCHGRCVNAIRHLEADFSYPLLLSMASNPWLPYRFRAVVVHLILALFVDRYPQVILVCFADPPPFLTIYTVTFSRCFLYSAAASFPSAVRPNFLKLYGSTKTKKNLTRRRSRLFQCCTPK
jgi:hypothetical protein